MKNKVKSDRSADAVGSKKKKIKIALIEAQNIIKKKFRQLHNHRANFDYSINETYKSISGAIQALVKEKAKRQTNSAVVAAAQSRWKKEIKKKEEEEADLAPLPEDLDWDNMEIPSPSNSVFQTAKADRHRDIENWARKA